MIRSIAEVLKVVNGTTPVTTNGGVDSDYVSLKNVNKLFIVAKLTQAVGHATTLAPYQATAVAGTSAKVLSNNCEILANEDVSASDTNTRQTAAKNYSVTNDIKNKIVIFEIDPATLDTANDFDCVKLNVSDSSQATNFVDITFYGDMKYKEDVPPAVITD